MPWIPGIPVLPITDLVRIVDFVWGQRVAALCLVVGKGHDAFVTSHGQRDEEARCHNHHHPGARKSKRADIRDVNKCSDWILTSFQALRIVHHLRTKSVVWAMAGLITRSAGKRQKSLSFFYFLIFAELVFFLFFFVYCLRVYALNATATNNFIMTTCERLTCKAFSLLSLFSVWLLLALSAYVYSTVPASPSASSVPAGSPLHGGDVTVYVKRNIKQPSLPIPL